MILFHGCLVHASTSNLSPWNRVSVYLSLCAMSNHIRRFKRPEYIAHRDFTPIECLPDDCLLRSYPVELPWKDGTPAAALQTVAGAETRSARDEPLRGAAAARGAGQAAAHRDHRRRQVRRHVPRASAEDARRSSRWASPTSRPGRRVENLVRVGWKPERCAAATLDDATHARHDARRRRLAGAGRASEDRHRRRMHRQCGRGGRALPRGLPPSGSTSST